MAKAPVTILHRPYAVVPATNLMNPDGFFVVNLGSQWIEAQITNDQAAELRGVRVYIEGISDPGVTRTAITLQVGDVAAGATFPVRFMANFHAASPGAINVSFIIEADGFTFRRVIKKIFVTRIDYDKTQKTYSVVMPQGTMKVRIHSAIMGGGNPPCKRDDGAFLVLPTDVSYDWVPTPPYEGVRGPFPYEDPWWKIALAILAGLIALGALLYDYFSDGDLDGGSVSVGGTFDETVPSVSCCTKLETSASDSDDLIAKGLYGAAGSVATAAIASDDPDPHYRGQEATPPAPGELTSSERVRLKIKYTEPPNLGRPFGIAGSWRYDRSTTGNAYAFEASDERQNIHWLLSHEVRVAEKHDLLNGPLRVEARFQRPDGSYFSGSQLYVSAVLVSTFGVTHRFNLKDDGAGFDKQADDAWYSGAFDLRGDLRNEKVHDPRGTWYLFVFAQDVNTVLEGTDPFVAAHTIGGFVITPQLVLAFNAPCQLRHDAVIQVV